MKLLFCSVWLALVVASCHHNGRLLEQANTGYPEAQYELGRRLLLGNKGMPRTPESALPWLFLSAEGGDHRAMAAIAACYERGIGVKKSVDSARSWYIKAAEEGNPHAVLALIRMESSLGSPEATLRWLSVLAETDSVGAQLLCGKLYLAGYGGEKSAEQAVRYLRFAAMQGCGEACYLMACCYAEGIGVPRDHALMLGWLVNAASAGYAEALDALNTMPVEK